jgi:hypothetical protein
MSGPILGLVIYFHYEVTEVKMFSFKNGNFKNQ